MKVEVFHNAEALGQAAAEFFVATAKMAVARQGRCSVALSGGNTPRYMYKYLAMPEMIEQVPWEMVHIFWGDERCVSLDSPENNAHMAQILFLAKAPIAPGHIHRIKSDMASDEAARNYEAELRGYFGHQPIEFDLIYLGLGEDGHTASLFPGSAIVKNTEHLVMAAYVDEFRMYRISLTLEIINRARNIMFLVTGLNKAAIVKKVLENQESSDKLPAQLVKPVDGQIFWYLDKDGASLLTDKSRAAAAL